MAFNKNVWDELVAEFPPLWNPRDLHFRDTKVKAKCLEQLLEKCNRISSFPITMEALRRQVKYAHTRRYRGTSQISDLQMPGMPQAQSESQTTPPRNTTPTTQTTRNDTKLKELVAEYPCLWDPQDPDYKDPVVREQCTDQLLVKYNRLFKPSITLEELRLKLRQKLLERKKVAPFSSGEDSTEGWVMNSEADSSDTVDETQHSNPCNNSNEIQRTTNVQNISNQQTGILNIVFHCCCVCDEVKSDCSSATDKPYIKNNKTELAMNDLSIVLNINKDANICKQCDTKLREMYDFVNLAKIAQDKMRHVNVLDEMAMDEDENEAQKFFIDSVSVTDTQLLKPNGHKRKCLQGSEQAPEAKKQFKVTIDLNLNDDANTMENIEAKYQMFKKNDSLRKSKDANESKVSQDNENFTHDMKKRIETTSKNNDKTGGIISLDDNRIHQNKEDSLAKSTKPNEASKVIITEDNICEKVNETGGIVNEGDNRNDIVTESRDTVKTNKIASVVNKLKNTGEPLCVIPQSELVQLVESIVSRMLNK